ncbi:hypothetical protein DM2_645 [Halorubrum sp. DM2]|nr:hypothetical protein DM2_645 [Halorubrum sp. DM2]
MLIGMGALAMGSGAAFTGAAFNSSTTPSADLRVVVEEALNFRPNPAATSADNVVSTDDFEGGFFDGEDIDDSEDGAFGGEDVEPPLAATNGEANGDLELFAVAGLGASDTFEELFILENDSTDSVAVGIAYDRGNSDFDTSAAGTGQYGGDIDVNGEGGLTPTIPRNSYRFRVNTFTDNSDPTGNDYLDGDTDGLISPAVNGDFTNGEITDETNANFVGGDEGISDDRDKPADAIILEPGEAVTIDLEVDIDYGDTVKESIRNAAGISLDGFGSERATVDLLDGITVGTLTGEPSS